MRLDFYNVPHPFVAALVLALAGCAAPHEQHLLEEIRTLTATTQLAQTRLLEVLAEHCRPVALPLRPSEVRPVAGDRL